MGVIAGADEWAGLDVTEAHLQSFGFEFCELARGVETCHGEVIARGAEVLADGEDVAADGGEIAEDGEEFVGFFAEADHYAGFGESGGSELFGVAQQLEGAFVAGAGADSAIEAGHRLGVVIQDFGFCLDDDGDGFAVSLEVGDEDFDAASGRLVADLVDDHGEDASAAEEIVVAVDAGDDGVFEAEGGDGFGHAAGLVEVDGLRAALGDGAESAAAGAEVAEHHEGGGFVMPALADVGALRALAHSVEAEGAGETLELMEVFADGRAGLQPLRLGSRGFAGGLDLDEFHLSLIVSGGRFAAGGTRSQAKQKARIVKTGKTECIDLHSLMTGALMERGVQSAFDRRIT